MLRGDPSPAAVCVTGLQGASYLPSDLDGATPPLDGTPAYFVDLEGSNLGMYALNPDFSTPSSSTLTRLPSLGVLGYTQASDSPQPGTSRTLDALSDRLMYRLAFRMFTDHEAMVVNHSVQTPSGNSGVRWYELRAPVSNNGTFTIYQQGTWAPDSSYRWMGSAAMDQAGNIALGYSVSSGSVYPSVRFTGRSPGDTLGLMDAESSIIDGHGSQTGYNRWGDYSSMRIDPSDDCTFWYVNEYLPVTSSYGWYTRIGSFKLAGCGASVDNPPTVSFTYPVDGATVSGPVNLTASASDDYGVSQVEFFVDGTPIGVDTDGSDGWTAAWDTTADSDGTHALSATATDTAGQTASDSISVNVMNNVANLSVHVANLDGSSTNASRGRWNASVTITVQDDTGQKIANATVSGNWGDGATGSSSCSTNTNGQCTVTKSSLKGSVASVSFTVTGISATGITYDSSKNTDPDGDSNGTTIVVCNGGCSTTSPPPSSASVHIHSLVGSATTGNGGKWNALVTITALDASDNPASGFTVTGDWSGAASGSTSCTTGTDGSCSVGKNNLRGTSATYQVSDILDASGASVWDNSNNVTSVTVNQP
jgi:hypothetical protein